MNNFLSSGKMMTYTAPAGGVVSGGGYLIGALFVAAATTVAAGLPFAGATEGVFVFAKNAGEGDLVEGQPLYWDVANTRFSIDPTVGLPVATVATAALSAAVTVEARLNGLSLAGRHLTIRKRFLIAAINAGATLVPAIPGIKIRHVDSQAIAFGGAAGTVTTVDILATQAAAPVKLVAFAQANLTRSTVVRAGAAGGAVLADGASYAANDVNTPVTIGHTGGAIDTATGVDVELTYTLE